LTFFIERLQTSTAVEFNEGEGTTCRAPSALVNFYTLS